MNASSLPPLFTALSLCIVLASAVRGTAMAQASVDSGAFVVRLGRDTLAVERYRRTAEELRGEIVMRVPEARRARYVATLGADGGVRGLDLEVVSLGPVTPVRPPARGSMRFRGDTADVALALADGVRRIRVPARGGAVPMAAFSHALVEHAVLQARRDGRDSVAFDWVGLGAPKAMPSYVVRCGDDSVRVAFFGDQSYLKLDRFGRLLRLDGRETTVKVVVERRPTVDLERWASWFVAAEARDGPMGPLSPRDTVRAVIDGAALTVEYGRPRRRGREIFGGVVPWDRIWRLGADAATRLHTTAAIQAGGHTIPRGAYSLWLLPTRHGATLIVNRQTGQWGTGYDPDQDLARIALRPEPPARPVEQLTIAIEPAGTGGFLWVAWDTTGYALPFTAHHLPPAHDPAAVAPFVRPTGPVSRAGRGAIRAAERPIPASGLRGLYSAVPPYTFR